MKIVYLNVNGFFGDSKIKEILASSNELSRVVDMRYDMCNKIIAEHVIAKMKNKNEEIDYDAIFLSEFDPHSCASKIFTEKLRSAGFELLYPHELDNIGNGFFSITVCFIKKNGYFQNKEIKTIKGTSYLYDCIIGEGSSEVPFLFATHYHSKIDDDMKKGYTIWLENNQEKQLVFFGDLNANSKSVKKDSKENNDELYKLMKKNGLKEICDDKSTNTTRYETIIDRVFASENLNVNVQVIPSFYLSGLSDHAALIVTIE